MSATLGELLGGELRREPGPLGGLLLDLAGAVKEISAVLARGRLAEASAGLARDLVLRACARGGEVAAMLSADAEAPQAVARNGGRGRYLLACDPLAGAEDLDANLCAGTIFSVLEAGPAGFLQAGARQVCAGLATYGPATVLVLAIGRGVEGFTLDRRFGELVHTHPAIAVPEEVAEQSCRRAAGALQVLLRGGVLACPGGLGLVCTAAPLALLVERAGGLASTGRGPLLEVVPASIRERVPAVLGSRSEVERLAAPDRPYTSPLFNVRSLLRET